VGFLRKNACTKNPVAVYPTNLLRVSAACNAGTVHNHCSAVPAVDLQKFVTIFRYCLNCTKFDELILSKIIKTVAIRCQILRLKCITFDFGWGSAPDPAGGVINTSRCSDVAQINDSIIVKSRMHYTKCMNKVYKSIKRAVKQWLDIQSELKHYNCCQY